MPALLYHETYLSIGIAYENHLLEEFPIGGSLWHNLPEDEQQLLDCVILHGQHKAYDGHNETRIALTIQQQFDYFLERLNFYIRVAFFEVLLQLHLVRHLQIRRVDDRVTRHLTHLGYKLTSNAVHDLTV